MKTEIKKMPKSQVEIEFELTSEEFQKHVDHALLHLKEHIKVDGFRPGQVPEKMVKERVGQENLLMEAGDIAVKETYSKYILENNLEPIGQPEVKILKIAEGNPLLFKITITILPEIKLPDYKEIVSRVKSKEVSVSEEEERDSLNYLQKTRAKFTAENRPAVKKDFVEIKYQNKEINDGKEVGDRFILGEGGFMQGFEDNIIGMKAGEEKEFKVNFPENSLKKDLAGKEGVFKVKMVSVQKMELPELNDEFAKQLGSFDGLAALKISIKDGLLAEKKEAEKQRRRGEFLEKIAAKTEFEIPEKLVDYEQQRLLEDLKNNVSGKFKISFEEYLSSVKQTEEELKKTFAKEAEKRLKNFLVLREIGKKEMVEVSEKELDEEMSRLPKGKFDIEQLKEYTKGVVQNEKIFQILEKLSQ